MEIIDQINQINQINPSDNSYQSDNHTIPPQSSLSDTALPDNFPKPAGRYRNPSSYSQMSKIKTDGEIHLPTTISTSRADGKRVDW